MDDVETQKEMVLSHGLDLSIFTNIEEVVDNSNELAARALIRFKNGYMLSVIKGMFTYGSNEGLFEIAAINKAGYIDDELFDEEDRGDTVCGYCSAEKVLHYISKLESLEI